MHKWPNGILFDIQHFDIVELTNKHIYWIELLRFVNDIENNRNINTATRIVTSYRRQLQKLI